MNFPSRRNSMFRRKTLLKLYRILELISSRGDHIFLTDKIFLSHWILSSTSILQIDQSTVKSKERWGAQNWVSWIFAQLPLNFLCRSWGTSMKPRALQKANLKPVIPIWSLDTETQRQNVTSPKVRTGSKSAVFYLPQSNQLSLSLYQETLPCRSQGVTLTLLGHVLLQSPERLMYVLTFIRCSPNPY